jgi:hypothetical protein
MNSAPRAGRSTRRVVPDCVANAFVRRIPGPARLSVSSGVGAFGSSRPPHSDKSKGPHRRPQDPPVDGLLVVFLLLLLPLLLCGLLLRFG